MLRQVGEGTLGRHGRYLPTVGLADLDAAGWPGSSGGSDHESRAHLGAVPDGVIATASRAGSLCDATGPRLLA